MRFAALITSYKLVIITFRFSVYGSCLLRGTKYLCCFVCSARRVRTAHAAHFCRGASTCALRTLHRLPKAPS